MAKHNFITDVHVTPGNVNDSVPYIERLDRQRKVFKFQVKRVALDAGYLTTPNCHALQQREILAVIGHRRFTPVKYSGPINSDTKMTIVKLHSTHAKETFTRT